MPRASSAPLLLLFLIACPGRDVPEQQGAAGSFELRHAESGRLIRGEALATYCEDDSSIAVIALTGNSSGGVAARLRWPAGGGTADSLRLGRRLAGTGTATMAWRAVRDSVGRAIVADSGVLSLRGDATVSGSGRAWATEDSTVVELEARLSDIPVEKRCPENPR